MTNQIHALIILDSARNGQSEIGNELRQQCNEAATDVEIPE
jgi:hypothetical protein